MIGLPYGEKNYDDMLSRFYLTLIPERHGQTDRQICYINIASQCADAGRAIKITIFNQHLALSRKWCMIEP